MLKGIPDCGCGKIHRCDIGCVEISHNALEKLPALTAKFHHILLVADTNTYSVCGGRVSEILKKQTEDRMVYESEGFLVPDERAVEILGKKVTGQTDFILGIGSGVISDLCKYVSFQKGLPYGIAATAPSMDGYASVGAAMITGGMKITYPAHVPYLIAADPDLLKKAPLEMIKSGYGDIIGKYSALNDWELSCEINGEYFCRTVYDLVYDRVQKVELMGSRLSERREEDIKTLMEALVAVGIAMSYVGNSRPASGSEHHLSHFFEVVGILKKEPYFHHGIDVAYSSVITQSLRERILTVDFPRKTTDFDRSRWENAIREIYGAAAAGIIQLQDKLGWYEQDRTAAYQRHWKNMKEILKKAPSAEYMMRLLQEAGLSFGEFTRRYREEKIEAAVWYAKDLKDRYTVLWLYYDLIFRG